VTITKADPLQALIAAAAKAAPITGEVARHQARADAASAAGSARVVIADVSSSMAEMAGASSKITLLRDALTGQRFDRLVAFAARPVEVASAELLPLPCGSTALHLAIAHAARWSPGRTLVISDGQPDSESMALESTAQLSGVIDVLYIGPEDDAAAIAFMTRLARAGSGRCAVNDLSKTGGAMLRHGIAAMLLPAGRPR
jgi:hypothetical protein